MNPSCIGSLHFSYAFCLLSKHEPVIQPSSWLPHWFICIETFKSTILSHLYLHQIQEFLESMKTKAIPKQLRISYAVEVMKEKCRFASFPELSNWGMVLAAWPQEYFGDTVSTWTREVQNEALQGVRASAAHCPSNGKIAVKAKRTISFPQNFHAGSSNFSILRIRMLNLHCSSQISYPVFYIRRTSQVSSLYSLHIWKYRCIFIPISI